jgi:hypothetical protein
MLPSKIVRKRAQLVSALATPRAGLASCQGDRSQGSNRLLTVTSITKWKSLCLYWARPIRSSRDMLGLGMNDSRDCAVIANTVMKDHIAKAISIGRK